MTVLDTFSLAGKVAVVTGGNRGLGQAFVHALGEAGASIAILARDADKSAEVVAELSDKGITAASFEGDVSSHADVERAAGEILSAYGRVDVLVNNAGICVHRPALEVTQDEWNDVINVNLTGVWNGCQVFGRQMIDAGGGVIVNVGSMSAQIVNRPQWQPAYNASKAGVHHLTKSLAAKGRTTVQKIWDRHRTTVKTPEGTRKVLQVVVERPGGKMPLVAQWGSISLRSKRNASKVVLDDAPALVATLRAAHEQGDREELRRAAHTLKSNGQTFGAERFSELCRELEERAKSDELDGAADLLNSIEREYAALEQTLAALRPTPAS